MWKTIFVACDKIFTWMFLGKTAVSCDRSIGGLPTVTKKTIMWPKV